MMGCFDEWGCSAFKPHFIDRPFHQKVILWKWDALTNRTCYYLCFLVRPFHKKKSKNLLILMLFRKIFLSNFLPFQIYFNVSSKTFKVTLQMHHSYLARRRKFVCTMQVVPEKLFAALKPSHSSMLLGCSIDTLNFFIIKYLYIIN